MDLSTDAQAVALIAPPVITAIAALGGVWIKGRIDSRREDKQFKREKRAEAYERVAAHVVRVRQYAGLAFPGIPDDHELMPPRADEGEHYDMHGLVEAYGSDRVRELYDELLTAHASVRQAVDTLREAKRLGQATPLPNDLDEKHTELKEACETLLDEIRDELQPGS